MRARKANSTVARAAVLRPAAHDRVDAACEVGAGVKMQVTGIGSQAHLHWGEGPIRDALTLRANLAELPELVHLDLLNRGIHISRCGIITLSTPMTDKHIQAYLDAIHETLRTLGHTSPQSTPLTGENPHTSLRSNRCLIMDAQSHTQTASPHPRQQKWPR